MSVITVCTFIARRCGYHPWRDCDEYDDVLGYCDACKGYLGADGSTGTDGYPQYHSGTECVHASKSLRSMVKTNTQVYLAEDDYVKIGRKIIPYGDIMYLSIDDGMNKQVLIDKQSEQNKGGKTNG